MKLLNRIAVLASQTLENMASPPHHNPLRLSGLEAVVDTNHNADYRTEVHHAEHTKQPAQKEEQNYLKSVLNALPGLIVELDRDGRLLTSFSPQMSHPFDNLSRHINSLPEKWMPPSLADIVHRSLRQADYNGSSDDICVQTIICEKSYWLMLNTRKLNEPHLPGETRYLIVIRDVTCQCQKIHQTKRLSMVAQHTINPVILTDANGCIVWVNSAFENKTGYSLSDIQGTRPLSVLHGPGTDPHTLTSIDAAVSTGRGLQVEVELYDRKGTSYWVEMDLQPIRDEHKQVTGFMAIQTDTSKQKRQLSDLRRSEDRARKEKSAAMDASRDGIAITDSSGNYTYINAAHQKMFGIADEALILGQHWTVLHTPETALHIKETIYPLLKELGSWKGDLIGRHADGTELQQEVSLSLKDDGGLICITRDISERLQLEASRMRLNEALQRAQRQEIIAQIAAGMVHDFNNMIAAIASSATLILRKPDENAKIHAERIMIASENSAKLVQRVLNYGARQPTYENVNVPKILNEAADLLKPTIGNRVKLAIDCQSGNETLRVDPTDFLQVVINLAFNARDALDNDHPHPKISIRFHSDTEEYLARKPAFGSLDRRKRYACLEVCDNGSGIENDALSRIFEPYFTTKGERGTGLGLVVVASVVDAYGGAIIIDSEKNSGTRMHALWKVDDSSAAPTQPRPTSEN